MNYLTENFDNNYKSNGKDWAFMVLFSPSLRGAAEQRNIKVPESSAFGIIKGHSLAFQVGRYGYELPPPPKLKPILYNIEGLQILSWITRALAYNTYEKLQEAKKANKGKEGLHSAKIPFPSGSIEKFPSDDT